MPTDARANLVDVAHCLRSSRSSRNLVDADCLVTLPARINIIRPLADKAGGGDAALVPTLIAFLLLIGPLVTIHELGHFIVAKLTGVRVLVFSLGFGPRLFGFKRGDTDYRISALPLGGYVRMYGDESAPDVPDNEKHYAFLEKPWWVKVAIAFAGPAANLALPIFLFFGLHVGSETVVDPVVGTAIVGDPGDLAGLQTGDRILAVDGEDVVVWDDLVQKIGGRANKVTVLSIDRGGARAELRVTPVPATSSSSSPSSSPPSSESESQSQSSSVPPVGRIGVMAARQLPFVHVANNSPAAGAGLKTGDRVVSVDGAAVIDRKDLFARLDASGASRSLVVERTLEATPENPKPQPQTLTLTLPAVPQVVAPTRPDLSCLQLPEGCLPLPPPPEPPEPAIRALRFAVLDEEQRAPAIAHAVAGDRAVVVETLRAQVRRRGLAPHEGTIVKVEPDTPAAAREVLAHQRVVSVDGKALFMAGDLASALGKTPDAVHSVGLVHPDGTGAVFVFRLQKSPRRELGGQKIFGVVLQSDAGGAVTSERNVSVAEAAVRAVSDTGKVIVTIADGFRQLFTGQVGLDQVGGPVLIASVAGEAAKVGPRFFIELMCLFSVNLGLLNLLPVPVLDGGHIVIVTIEAVRRKKLDVATRNRVTQMGLLFVGALMMVALWNDLSSLLP